MGTRKPQTVSRRAASYARALKVNGPYSQMRLAQGWSAGYRRAMCEVRHILNRSVNPLFELDQLSQPERMK